LPKLGGVWPDLMRGGTADGRGVKIHKPFNESAIRAMISID
jgi:hypothetical protein